MTSSIHPESELDPPTKLPMELSNKWYNRLRWIVQLFLPALGTLYFTLSTLWGEAYFPAPDKVVGTIAALALFLGVIVGISHKQYKANSRLYDGTLFVDETDPQKDRWTFRLDEQLDEAKYRDTVNLRVIRTR